MYIYRKHIKGIYYIVLLQLGSKAQVQKAQEIFLFFAKKCIERLVCHIHMYYGIE